MAVRKFKPTTPGQRHKIIGAFDKEPRVDVEPAKTGMLDYSEYKQAETEPSTKTLEEYDFEAINKAKADKVIINWTDDEITKLNYKYRSVKSLSKYEKWEIEKLQHRVDVVPVRIFIEDSDPDGLKGIDQAKVGKVRMNTYPILKPYIVSTPLTILFTSSVIITFKSTSAVESC